MAPDPDFTALTDEALLCRMNAGDTGAFTVLYDRYSRRLFYFILRMLNGEKTQAEDLLQEVFLTLVEHGHRFKPGHSFSTWIFTITRNKIKNVYRQRNGKTFEPLEGADSAPSLLSLAGIESGIDMAGFTKCLQDELLNLSEAEQSTFWLRHQEGFSIREISSILACPEGTIHSRLHHLTAKMAGRLAGYKILLEENDHGV